MKFTFEDILQLNDSQIRELLQNVTNEDLTFAIHGASPGIRDKVFNNLADAAQEMILEDEKDVEIGLHHITDARNRISETIEQLAMAWPGVLPGERQSEQSLTGITLPDDVIEGINDLPDFDLLESDTERIIQYWSEVLYVVRRYNTLPSDLVAPKLKDPFSQALFAFPEGASVTADALLTDMRQKLNIMQMAAIALHAGKTAEELLDVYRLTFPNLPLSNEIASRDTPENMMMLAGFDNSHAELIENILPLLNMAQNEGLLSLEQVRDEILGYMGYGVKLSVDQNDLDLTLKLLSNSKKAALNSIESLLSMMCAVMDCLQNGRSPTLLEEMMWSIGLE